MDGRHLRLQLLLGGRPQGANPDFEHSAGVPAQPGNGVGRGHRLPRLAHSTRTAVSGSPKLWFVIRHYGVEGLQHHVRQHVRLAQQFADWVRNDERFELAAPAPLNLVCFRHKGGDGANQTIMDRLNRSGDLFLTHTKLNGKLTLRLCVGQTTKAACGERVEEDSGGVRENFGARVDRWFSSVIPISVVHRAQSHSPAADQRRRQPAETGEKTAQDFSVDQTGGCVAPPPPSRHFDSLDR